MFVRVAFLPGRCEKMGPEGADGLRIGYVAGAFGTGGGKACGLFPVVKEPFQGLAPACRRGGKREAVSSAAECDVEGRACPFRGEGGGPGRRVVQELVP